MRQYRHPLFVIAGVLLIQSAFGQGGNCIIDSVNTTSSKNFYNLKQKRVTGISIAKGKFKGLLEYVPAGYYNVGNTTKYPVIIYFHGRGAMGQGTTKDLCKILWDGFTTNGNSMPGRIERNEFPASVAFAGINYSFIVISPQYTVYNYPSDYPSANEVDSVIKYVKSKYRVDPKRVYLTGMSAGANMVAEYAGSSTTRASTIAAAATASLCSPVNSSTNVARGIKPKNIGLAKLPFWFMQCQSDGTCPPAIPQLWVDSIKKVTGHYPPTFTVLNNANTVVGLKCNAVAHNTWSTLYNPTFRLVNNKNIYEYFIQFSRPTLTSAAYPAGDIVREAEMKKGLIVNPNPFSDELATFVTITKSQQISLRLTDLNGRTITTKSAVYTAGTNRLTLNTQNLAKGMYLLRIDSEELTRTVKVLKR